MGLFTIYVTRTSKHTRAHTAISNSGDQIPVSEFRTSTRLLPVINKQLITDNWSEW